MIVEILTTLATPVHLLRARKIYDLPVSDAEQLINSGLARLSERPPEYAEQLLERVYAADGKPAIFLPPAGVEFGHEIMTRIRWIHASNASHKVVCCRPGCEVLYPSADEFVTDWTDPISDRETIGTCRDHAHAMDWSAILARYPDHMPVITSGLTPEQELFIIEPTTRIPFAPKSVIDPVDVVFATRKREFASRRNWSATHWQLLADACRNAGLTYAVIGTTDHSINLDGARYWTQRDTDAAIHLLQHCKLYVGTDSGPSHLAAEVGANMLLFREAASGSRDLTVRMAEINPGRVAIVANGWNKPERVRERMLDAVRRAHPEWYTAQHGEDRWLEDHWSELGLPDKGIFVEVGAADGIKLSNTYWLAKAKGWTGLLVEPDPRQMDKLNQNRPESLIYRFAAGATQGKAKFSLHAEPTLSGLKVNANRSVEVPVFTLDHLLQKDFDRVDVLSIDTEGTEVDVWKGFDASRWKPRVVIAEWNTHDQPSQREQLTAAITADGYRVAAELGGNFIFVRERE